MAKCPKPYGNMIILIKKKEEKMTIRSMLFCSQSLLGLSKMACGIDATLTEVCTCNNVDNCNTGQFTAGLNMITATQVSSKQG